MGCSYFILVSLFYCFVFLPRLVLIACAYWCSWVGKDLHLLQIMMPLLCDVLLRPVLYVVAAVYPAEKLEGEQLTSMIGATNVRSACRNFSRLANVTVNIWVYEEMRDFVNSDDVDMVLWTTLSVYLGSMVLEIVLHLDVYCLDAAAVTVAVKGKDKARLLVDFQGLAFVSEIELNCFEDVDKMEFTELCLVTDSTQSLLQLVMAFIVASRGGLNSCGQDGGALLVVKVVMDFSSNLESYMALDVRAHAKQVCTIIVASAFTAFVMEAGRYWCGLTTAIGMLIVGIFAATSICLRVLDMSFDMSSLAAQGFT